MSDSEAGGASYDVAGYAFRIGWEGRSGQSIAARLFASSRVDVVPAQAASYGIYRRGEALEARCGESVIATADSEMELAAHLDAHIANAALEHLTGAVAIHAGAVARGDRTVVLAGTGGSGKTTLCLALCLAGLQPLCDDMLLVEEGGRQVRALPRSFLVKGDTGTWLAERLPGVRGCAFGDGLYSVPREALGAPLDEAVPTHIVFPTYVPGAPVRLEPLGQLAAMERLLPLACLPYQKLFGVVEVVRRAAPYALVYGSREAAALALQGLVA